MLLILLLVLSGPPEQLIHCVAMEETTVQSSKSAATDLQIKVGKLSLK